MEPTFIETHMSKVYRICIIYYLYLTNMGQRIKDTFKGYSGYYSLPPW